MKKTYCISKQIYRQYTIFFQIGILAVGINDEGPFTFASSPPYILFHWSSSNHKIALVESVHSEVSILVVDINDEGLFTFASSPPCILFLNPFIQRYAYRCKLVQTTRNYGNVLTFFFHHIFSWRVIAKCQASFISKLSCNSIKS